MSQRQGVIKRDFYDAVQTAIGQRLRGQTVPAGTLYPQLLLMSTITSLSPSYNNGLVPILDYMGVEKMTQFPYITIGDDSTGTPDDTKGGSGEQVLVNIHIWCKYNGKYEAAYIGNQVLLSLTGSQIDMSSTGFSCYGFKKEFDHTMKDGNNAVHRILRFRMWIQDIQTIQPL